METEQLADFSAANYCDHCLGWSACGDYCSRCGHAILCLSQRSDRWPTLSSPPAPAEQQSGDSEQSQEETVSYESDEDEDSGAQARKQDANYALVTQLPFHARELYWANMDRERLRRENAALRDELAKRKAQDEAEASHGLVATLKRVCFGDKSVF